MRMTRRVAALAGPPAAALVLAGAGLALGGLSGSGPGGPLITDIRVNPQSVEEGSRVEFVATVEADDIAALDFRWDFGDGHGTFEAPGAAATRYRYRDGGEGGSVYTVTLTVTDPAGRTTMQTAPVEVLNVDPRIQFLHRDGAGLEDAPVSFRAGATDPGVDDDLTFEWDFGDGATARGRRVEHRYSRPGAYTVTLRVDDGDGGVTERSTLVVIGEGGAFSVSGDISVPETDLTMSVVSGSLDNAGRCMLRLSLNIEGEASLGLSAVLPRGLGPGTYAIGAAERPTAVWQDEYRSPGTVFAGLGADAKHHPPERGMFPLASQGGTLDVTYFDGERIELSFTATLRENTVPSANPAPRVASVTGWLARAVGSSIMRRGAIPGAFYLCDVNTRRPMRVVTTEPAANALNVDLEDPMISVELDAPVDMATVHDGTFRIEYRLPDTGPEAQYQEVPGVVEQSGDGGFRFVPVSPLMDGVFYRATVVGGEEGVRGADGETLDRNRSWAFGTLVEPDAVRLAVYQVSRNAPLVPGKTTLTRVWVDWTERTDVHEEWQVRGFPAHVEANVDGRPVYPAEGPVTVRRPDQFTTADSAMAAHTTNLFGWTPAGIGGRSTITAVLKPVDPEGGPPQEFSSAPLTLQHHTASPRLTYAAYRIRIHSWEDDVPAHDAALAQEILREGTEFTLQNFPIVEFDGYSGMDIPVSEPIFQWGTKTGTGVLTYSNGASRDGYFARQVMDLVADHTEADVLILFFPKETQPGWTGYAYTKSRPYTFGLFIPPETGEHTVTVLAGSVAHELGHTFGFSHTSRCPKGGHVACMTAGKSGSDDIEGFRLASDGSGGWNKSKTEGNAEAPRTGAVLSLMFDDAIGMANVFILDEHYRELLRHPALSMAAPGTRPDQPAGGHLAHADSDVGDVARRSAGPAVRAAEDGTVAPAPPYLTAGLASFTSLLDLRRPTSNRPAATLSNQDNRSFVVSGVVLPDDEAVGLEPLRVIDRPVRVQEEGPYTLELLDGSGSVLQAASFATIPLYPGHITRDDGTIESDDERGPGDEDSAGGWFRVELPYSEGPHAVRVRRGETELIRLDRSPSSPTVRFSSPSPASDVPSGPRTFSWSGEDIDGDQLGYTLEYSPDGQTEWRRITPWTADTRIRLDLGGLPAGPRPTLRVVASDGIRQGTDRLTLPVAAVGGGM